MGQWFDLTGDARLGACATEGCGGQPTKRLEAGGVGSNYCSGCAAKIEALSAVALPDELEVVAWRYRPAHVPATAPWAYMDDREPSASFTAEALACASEAHSTIAALRAKLREVVEEREAWLEASIRQQKRAETAEAELKRLTEDNEALRGALEALVDQADHVTAGARTSADINKAARNLFPLCVAARAILTQENADG